MSAEEEQNLFRAVLLWMVGREERRRRLPGYGDALGQLRRELADRYVVCDSATLETLLPRDHRTELDLSASKRFIFLEAWERAPRIPVMSVYCNFVSTPSVVRLRTALFLLTPNDLGHKVQAVGYRFETPEGPQGRHSYHHAQPIRAFDAAGSELPGAQSWLPTTDPTFAPDADNPISLIFCMLVSLYGADYMKSMVGLKLIPRLRQYLDGTGLHSLRARREAT